MRYSQEHKAATRARIVEAAGRVFRERGYAGAGVDAVSSAAGVTSGAFYTHFPSKEACLEAVVREAVSRNEQVREAGLGGLSGRAWAVALMRRYMSEGHWERVAEGCPIPTLVSELPRTGAGARDAFGGAVGELIDRVTERASEDGEEDGGGRVRERVVAALAMSVGALALARAVGDGDLAAEILEAGRGAGLERLIGGGDGG